MSEEQQITEAEALDVITRLKDELGDKMTSMTGIVLEGITAKEMADSLRETIELLWVESGFNLVLRAPPQIEFKYRTHPPAQVFATPLNESAKRLIQLLNLMHPTHRRKRSKE